MKLDYDEDGDVLYVVFSDPMGPCSYTETEDGDILRTENRTGQVVGCTVPSFLYRSRTRGEIAIPQLSDIRPGNLLKRTS